MYSLSVKFVIAYYLLIADEFYSIVYISQQTFILEIQNQWCHHSIMLVIYNVLRTARTNLSVANY